MSSKWILSDDNEANHFDKIMAGRDDTSAIDADETVRLAKLQAEDKDLLHGIVTVAGASTDLLRKNNGQDNEDVEDAKEEDGQAVRGSKMTTST